MALFNSVLARSSLLREKMRAVCRSSTLYVSDWPSSNLRCSDSYCRAVFSRAMAADRKRASAVLIDWIALRISICIPCSIRSRCVLSRSDSTRVLPSWALAALSPKRGSSKFTPTLNTGYRFAKTPLNGFPVKRPRFANCCAHCGDAGSIEQAVGNAGLKLGLLSPPIPDEV